MSMNMDSQNIPQPVPEEQEIDWQAYISKAWKGRKLIIIVTAIFTVLGLVSALTMTRRYTTTVTLAPELGKSGSSSSLSGLASMLGMGGMSMASTADAYNVTTYPDIVSSTPFLTKLFDIHVQDTAKVDTTLIGYMTRKKGFSLLEFIFGEKEEEEKPLNIFMLTRKQANVVKALTKCITTDVDKKNGLTTINVTMDNPFVSAIVADSVCQFLREYIIDYRTSKAREDLAYYEKLSDECYAAFKQASDNYARYQDHNRGLVLNSVIIEGNRLQNESSIATQVYTQMKQQTEMARAKVQEEKPVFAVIQPATVPLRPANSRLKVLIMWMFFGFAASVAWVLFGQEYKTKVLDLIKTARKE